jgi:H/ACA ribonucleoprotein complex subunit 2
MGSDTEAEKSIQKEKKKYAITLAPIAKPLAGKKTPEENFQTHSKSCWEEMFEERS